jgi:hypothetical protein
MSRHFFPHAQIIPICPPTFALCSDMLLLSPFLCYWPPTRVAAERNRASTKATRRSPTCPVCSNHFNLPIELCFMFRYAFVVAVLVLLAADRVLAAAAEWNRVSTKATRRPGASPVCVTHSNISSDLCFIAGYAFAVVVVVVLPPNRVLAGQADRPPAHHYAPGCLATFPACANYSNMPFDRCFMLMYGLVLVVVVV